MHRIARTLALGVLLTLATAAPAGAQVSTVDLRRANPVFLPGGPGDAVGYATAAAGDFDGDGLRDLIVGAPYADFEDREDNGAAFIVFGRIDRPARGRIDLQTAASTGGAIRIDGASSGDLLGWSVAGNTDMNRDGFDDVVIGAFKATFQTRRQSGIAYVIYGGPRRLGAIDVRELGESGFAIGGASPGDWAGWSVSRSDDFNGDRIRDLVVGAPRFDRNFDDTVDPDTNAGAAYVVFGRGGPSRTDPVDLAGLGADGVRIFGGSPGERLGAAVADARYISGDGRSEVVLGAPAAGERPARRLAGRAYVVYGQDGGDIDTLNLPRASGFVMEGSRIGARAGTSVTGLADVNRDGTSDVAIGAPGDGSTRRPAAGAAYVVFGQTRVRTVPLRAIGRLGRRILGGAAGDAAGSSIAGGDVNGDGRSELVIGAPEADVHCRGGAGAAYVVPAAGGTRDLARIPRGSGFRIDGARPGDKVGASVAAVGPVIGSRLALSIGAFDVDFVGRQFGGAAYLVTADTRKGRAEQLSRRLPVRLAETPGGFARDYENFLSLPLVSYGGSVRNMVGRVYTFSGRQVGGGKLRILRGRGTLHLRLRERLRRGGYTVIMEGKANPRRFCLAFKTKVLKFQ